MTVELSTSQAWYLHYDLIEFILKIDNERNEKFYSNEPELMSEARVMDKLLDELRDLEYKLWIQILEEKSVKR